MTTIDYASLADELAAARRDRTTIVPPSTRAQAFALTDGYAVGALLCDRHARLGDRRVGLKIGFTNTALWTAFGLAEPICAPVYESTVRHGGDQTSFSMSALVAPKLEPEIVIGLDSSGPAWWALGYEIVDCHYADWKMGPADAVADAGLHAALLVGPRMTLGTGAPELRTPFGVQLFCNGGLVESSTTRVVLGSPLVALAFATGIGKKTAALEPPQPGELVTTGSLTTAFDLKPGQTWQFRADGITASLDLHVT